ncbi:MAG: hypothetical protein ACYTGH_10165 [Planctomycetota bacterium]|jgi:hypothetical protein
MRGFKKLISKCLSRRNLFVLFWVWGILAIGISLLFSAPFASAPEGLQESLRRDVLWHFQLSAMMTGGAALAIYAMGTLPALKDARVLSLRESNGTFLLFDLIAVIGATGVAYGVGYLKEMGDAMSGKFADVSDLSADLSGIITIAVLSLILSLPFHGAAALLGDLIRRGSD